MNCDKYLIYRFEVKNFSKKLLLLFISVSSAASNSLKFLKPVSLASSVLFASSSGSTAEAELNSV
jgi:hypothetical protein